MDTDTLYHTLKSLLSTRYHPSNSVYVYRQVVDQYNSLLLEAKRLYPNRPEIQGMRPFLDSFAGKEEFEDAIARLTAAIELADFQLATKIKPDESSNNGKFGTADVEAFKREISTFSNDALVSCLFMDLDNFKSVNDQYNHSVGDQVIRETIDVVESAIYGKGKVFHRSGDEILALLPNFDAEEARAVAERIRRAVGQQSFTVIGLGVVTMTIGVSTAPTYCTLEEVETSADTAAMAVKRSNQKNRVVHSGIGIPITSEDEENDASPLHGEVDDEELELLSAVATLRDQAITALITSNFPHLQPARVDYYLNNLVSKRFLEVVGVDYRKRGLSYKPTQKGLKLLISNNLI